MEKHFSLSDDEFEHLFASCELDPTIFSHEAHLRLAWIHIRRYGLEKAEKNLQEQLKAYTAVLGAQDKFNTTLTLAAMPSAGKPVKAVNHFMHKSTSDSFQEFILKYPRLKYDFKELMAAHYGFDIYNSRRAKREYLEPDLMGVN